MAKMEIGTILECKAEDGLFIKVIRFDDNKIYSKNGDTIFAVNNRDGKEISYDPTQILDYWKVVDPDEVRFSVHAEFWQLSRGLDIPSRNTSEWESMYQEWVEYAFQDFGE